MNPETLIDPSAVDPADAAEKEDFWCRVRWRIDPDDLLYQHHVEKRTAKELGEKYKVSEECVKSRLKELKKRAKRMLREY